MIIPGKKLHNMVREYPSAWRVILILSILLTFFSMFAAGAAWSTYIAGLLILLIGIPHGAADHYLFQQLYAQRYGKRAVLFFYVGYLGLIGLVFIGWYLMPILTMVLFLLLSAFHFGQGNFAYLKDTNWMQRLLFLFWGTWVVFTPICFHMDEARPILTALLGRELPLEGNKYLSGLPVLMLLVLAGFQVTILYENYRKYIFLELLSLSVLLLVFYCSPLLLGFAIYFSMWHAIPSALDQTRFLYGRLGPTAIRNYLRSVVPFSVLAVLGMFGIFYLQTSFEVVSHWSWLFACTAALTLPHMLILDRVYDRLLPEYDF